MIILRNNAKGKTLTLLTMPMMVVVLIGPPSCVVPWRTWNSSTVSDHNYQTVAPHDKVSEGGDQDLAFTYLGVQVPLTSTS